MNKDLTFQYPKRRKISTPSYLIILKRSPWHLKCQQLVFICYMDIEIKPNLKYCVRSNRSTIQKKVKISQPYMKTKINSLFDLHQSTLYCGIHLLSILLMKTVLVGQMVTRSRDNLSYIGEGHLITQYIGQPLTSRLSYHLAIW